MMDCSATPRTAPDRIFFAAHLRHKSPFHGDLDPLTQARNMGTSVQHLQRHYSHVENIQNAAADKRRDKASDETSRAIEHVIEEALVSRSSQHRCAI